MRFTVNKDRLYTVLAVWAGLGGLAFIILAILVETGVIG